MPSSLNALQSQSPELGIDVLSTTPSNSQPGLEALPNEILDHIVAHLSARSILSLRQSSRTLAVKIPFDERFWRRHLCSGSLLPHVWGFDETKLKDLLQPAPKGQTWDWRDLTEQLRVKHVLSTKDDVVTDLFPHGFWNRCRIWNIVSSACRPSSRYKVCSDLNVEELCEPEKWSNVKSLLTIGISSIIIMAVWRDLSTTAW